MTKDNTFMEYSLFTEVEDVEVRDRNRGQVMMNIFEDHCVDGVIDAGGLAILLGYFSEIPSEERADAFMIFQAMCQAAGYTDKPTTH